MGDWVGAEGYSRDMEMSSPPIYVLTRIAQLYPPEVAPPPSEEWLSSRLDIFKKYTLPSIQRQTNQDFHWLLLVSEGVSRQWISDLESLVHPRGKVVIQEGFTSEGESFRRFLENQADSMITVWFDSDDIIHPEFISQVRAANVEKAEVLSFVKGAVYQTGTFRSAVFKNHRNSFISFHESGSRNVFLLGPHSYIRSDSTKTLRPLMTKEPMWLQIVHGGNLSNWFRNYARPVSSHYLSEIFQEPRLAGHLPFRLKAKDWLTFAATISDRVLGKYIRRFKRKLKGLTVFS